MDDVGGGRGRREKIPSAKLKEQVVKIDRNDDEKHVTLPSYIAANDPKFFLDQKEVAKSHDHTKILPTGERVEFCTLSGTHVESKDRRYYIRAKRDPGTFYFHTCEVPPLYARLSDENHQQCAADKAESCFTRDMLGKTGEFGNYTTRANVFVREGSFCWETRLLSVSNIGSEAPRMSLAEMQSRDHSRTDRGGLRVGFVRREHSWSENLGTNAYSYAFAARGTGTAEYGNVRFNSEMFKVKGINPGNLKVGDVIGLKITLPPLEVHKKVVDGTFNPAEYPHLSCGPANLKSKNKSTSKKGSKPPSKQKDPDAVPKSNKKSAPVRITPNPSLTPLIQSSYLPSPHEILRDRNPFLQKGIVYFECPDYTSRPDLMRPMTRGKTTNPETGKPYQIEEDSHPNHELPHLRTLPSSKIEIWVNGKYLGVVWEHLLAFLPPASFIEKSNKTNNLWGDVDDGQLGYYPALSTFSGGAAECRFDGPWWYGFDDHPPSAGLGGHEVRAIGERYAEQIAEDFVCDVVDEIYLEASHKDDDWMKRQALANSAAPAPPAAVVTTAPAATSTPQTVVNHQTPTPMTLDGTIDTPAAFSASASPLKPADPTIVAVLSDPVIPVATPSFEPPQHSPMTQAGDDV